MFKSCMQLPFLRSKSTILFLNKADLFEEKLRAGADPGRQFKRYKGGCNVEKATRFFHKMFEECHAKLVVNDMTEVYTHVTTATNTENVRFAWEACRDVVMKGSLEDNAMLC